MKILKIHQHITHKQYYIIASSTDKKISNSTDNFFYGLYTSLTTQCNVYSKLTIEPVFK